MDSRRKAPFLETLHNSSETGAAASAALVLILTLIGEIAVGGPPSDREDPVPFARLIQETANDLRWADDKEPLVKMFNEERDRLKDRFEVELAVFVDKNVRRHYWSASFITNSWYLQGRAPKRYLGLSLYQQGLLLALSGREPSDSEASFRKLMAIGCMRAGFVPLAIHNKKLLEQHIESSIIKPGGPAIDWEEYELYESIPAESSQQNGQAESTPPRSGNGDSQDAQRIDDPAPPSTQRIGISYKNRFSELARLASEGQDWTQNAAMSAKLLREARDRLGKNFDPALLRFVGNDPSRHYWCAVFLVSPKYLEKREWRVYLSQVLLEQGLILARQRPGQRQEEINFRFMLAVCYWRIGLRHLAIDHKKQIVRLGGDRKEFRVIRRADLALFDTIPLKQ